jgi:3-oxoacyl-[acyl-carrier-protein] synthase-1
MGACYVHQIAAACALGEDIDAIAETLFTATRSPLVMTDDYLPGRVLPVGRVDVPPLADTRNNSLLAVALAPLRAAVEQLKTRYGAERIAVILGSSTSGIAEGEAAVAHHLHTGEFPPGFHYRQQEMSAPAEFVAQELQISGPAWTISTACTSGAKAIASGARLLDLGVCDAVIVGGADALCRLTVTGFASLEAVSDEVCNPFSANRKGINIGEAAALMILSREPGAVRLAGYGETSDAHHISAPHPEGLGAEAAMRAALANAGLQPADIDYINLHGTATEHNDQMESHAVARVFGSAIPCGSTKPLTGHTLGAAGALEAIFCYLTLMQGNGRLPRHLWDGVPDPALGELLALGAETVAQPVRYAMSNSFAFGGNNIALILERCDG